MDQRVKEIRQKRLFLDVNAILQELDELRLEITSLKEHLLKIETKETNRHER